jgi:hypothetical protein
MTEDLSAFAGRSVFYPSGPLSGMNAFMRCIPGERGHLQVRREGGGKSADSKTKGIG